MGKHRSYLLFCAIAQTGQVFDMFRRSGDVHDANGAEDSIRQCLEEVQRALSSV